jgi:uncharacterized OB-fold protein
MSNSESRPDSKKNQVPIDERFFKLPVSLPEEPRLLGSRCKSCGEVFFPGRKRCIMCFAEEMEELTLSRTGKIYSYTVVHNVTPGYTGPVPYAVAAVELPEGIVIMSSLTQCDYGALKVGMDVELILEKQYEDEDGNEVIAYKFRPI